MVTVWGVWCTNIWGRLTGPSKSPSVILLRCLLNGLKTGSARQQEINTIKATRIAKQWG